MKARSQFKCGPRDPERNREIDLRLAVLCALQQPGECISHAAINEVAGLSHGGSNVIEQRALMKLRQKLKYTSARELGAECTA